MICSNEAVYLAVKLLALIGALSLIAATGIFMFYFLSRAVRNETITHNRFLD
jgi:hypothetical protein